MYRDDYRIVTYLVCDNRNRQYMKYFIMHITNNVLMDTVTSIFCYMKYIDCVISATSL